MFSRIRHFLGLAALIGFLTPAQAAGDPPGRVGRLSQIDGNVTLRADREDPGGPAAINWPISSGTIIDTGRRSRAEVWVGSTAYRLAGNSRAEFAAVNDEIVDLVLAEGALAVTIRDRDQADDLQVSTPGGRVRFPGPGRYRIEVRPDRTTVTAQAGSAEVETGERPITVHPGEMAIFDERGPIGVEAAPYGDEFDAWVSAQDNRERSNAARRHVSPYMTGHQDLDAYGDWSSAPDYGTVWYPRAVAADWAPYRDGRWAWIEPWGWTWVDAAPWGFAPFHYGRWVQVGGRWGWAPGRYAARPVYAPALVGWVGDPGWNVRFGHRSAPAVGWFPLAPREVYVPAYRTSPTYVRRINVAHVHDHAHIDRALRPEYRPHYAHQGQPKAVTVVPANMLREGKPINRHSVRPYDRDELGQGPVKPRAPGGDWLAPPAGAARAAQRNDPERHAPQRQQVRQPSERFQQPAAAMPLGGQEGRRDIAPPAGRLPESGGRHRGAEAARGAPETSRNMENRGRMPSPDDRQGSRAMPGAPRVDHDRPQPAMPAQPMREERSRQAPQAIREMQQPAPVQREQRHEIQREPQQYREARQFRQPQPERPAAMPRETPRAMPQPQFQPPPQAQPPRQPQPSAPPMREMPREAPRAMPPRQFQPPPQAQLPRQPSLPPMREMPRNEPRQSPQLDHNRGGRGPDNHRGGDRDPR
jgi:hypothetical protein